MRQLVCWLSSLLLVSAIAGAEGLSIPYELFVLDNGLTVILHEDHTTPTVAVNVWYHVGSGREKPGRTGFAHLFEHLLFEGSANVAEGKFDQWLEAAGGINNGSTNTDRTNYWESMPSNALELALFLESDRMGFLLGSMSLETVDGQRDVVKNERRQSYENRPYGMAWENLAENLFSPDHPYHWTTIGSMEDLSAASYEDVVEFFKKYYAPGNASLVIAGDIDPDKTERLVRKWFADVPAGAPVEPSAAVSASLTESKYVVIEDQVQLPRLYQCWISPAYYYPGDAEMDLVSALLTTGKSSRLYRRLVYEDRIAQDVVAFQDSRQLGSMFCIMSTAREGHDLVEIETAIGEELDRIRSEAPEDRELTRILNGIESNSLRRLEQVGGFGGKADLLNGYFVRTGNPDYFEENLARYRAVDAADLRAAVRAHLDPDARVILSIVPEGRKDLAVMKPSGKETER